MVVETQLSRSLESQGRASWLYPGSILQQLGGGELFLNVLTFWFSSACTTWLATWGHKARELSWRCAHPSGPQPCPLANPTDLIQTAFVSLPLVLIGLRKR